MLDSEKNYPIPEWVFKTLDARRFIINQFMKVDTVGAELGVFRGVFYVLVAKGREMIYIITGST